MIFNINSTRGQTRFLTCVARVTCLIELTQLVFALCFAQKCIYLLLFCFIVITLDLTISAI